MAWIYRDNYHSAEAQDLIAEAGLGYSNLSIQSTRVATGARGFAHDYTTSGSPRIGPSPGFPAAGELIAVSMFAGVDVAPTLEGSLWCLWEDSPAAVYRHIRVGTDRKVRIYDKNGVQRGPTSTTTIPTNAIGGMREIVVFFDGLTLSTVWVSVFFDGVEELAFDTTLSWGNFFATGAFIGNGYGDQTVPAGGYGFTLYTDDLATKRSVTAGDAPHLTAYPRLRGNGQMQTPPTSVGLDEWESTDCVGAKYQCVDDLGGHDGDTTRVITVVKGKKQTFKYAAANPTPNPCTIDLVQLLCVGKLGADKLGAACMVALGASETFGTGNSATPTSTYSRGGYTATRPGGGAWTRADAEPGVLAFGWRSENDPAIGTSATMTLQGGPTWVYYTASLPLATTPVAAGHPAIRRHGSALHTPRQAPAGMRIH